MSRSTQATDGPSECGVLQNKVTAFLKACF